MKLALLSGGYPPDFDAIGQYTMQLARELIRQGHDVTVFTSNWRERETTEAAGVKVFGAFDPARQATLGALPEVIERAAHGAEPFDWLIVQYNPFSFGRRGYCPALVGALESVKQRKLARVAIMFHETCVPLWPLKAAVMWTWQYPVFCALCRLAEQIFVSTERWTPQVRRARRDLECHPLAVGSNIPLCEWDKRTARRKIGLAEDEDEDEGGFVLGIFGNVHPSRLMSWMGEAARALYAMDSRVKVLYIGKDGDAVREACHGVPCVDLGVLPDEEVGIGLRAMDALASPFSDGISARRSSAIAGLLHGLPILTTRARWSDRILLDHPLVYADAVEAGPAAFVAMAKKVFENQGRYRHLPPSEGASFESSPFEWPVIVCNLLASL